MTTTERKALIDRDRKRHHAALAELAASLGGKLGGYPSMIDGLKLWRKLARIERFTHRCCTDYCNGLISERAMDHNAARAKAEVKAAFGGKLPPQFHVNRDPRGYALKLASNDSGTETATPFELYQDWGRNQILAPTIE